MVETPTFVIDASIVARWLLNTSPFLAEALLVRSDFQTMRISLLAPDNLRYEVPGAIHRAVAARHLRAVEGEAQIGIFLGYEIDLVDSDPLILSAYRLSIRFGCSFYDSLYLAVAELTNRPFLHADASLHRALNDRFPLEAWIEDYRSPI